MKPISLYNLKSTASGWVMTKFNEDLEPQTSYAMHYLDQVLHCSCPAMARHTCRHREMFPEFVARDRINTTWFLVENDRSWRQFVGPFEQIAPDHEAPVFEEELENDGDIPGTDHTLYRTGDTDAPDNIKDRNGEIILSLCRVCGKGEAELEEPCIPVPTAQSEAPEEVPLVTGGLPVTPSSGVIGVRRRI